jgi:hypothetical protein
MPKRIEFDPINPKIEAYFPSNQFGTYNLSSETSHLLPALLLNSMGHQKFYPLLESLA